MNKSLTLLVETFSAYTVIHALMHIFPIIIAFGVSGHVHHTHDHGHMLQDTIVLTVISHLALPTFMLYAAKLKSANHLYLAPNLLHKHW